MARKWALLFTLFYGPLVFQGAYNVYKSTYQGLGYPYDTPMVAPEERFGDFFPLYMHGLLLRRGGNPYTEKALYEWRVPDLLSDLPARVTRIRVPQIYFPLANVIGWCLSFLSARRAYSVYAFVILLGGIAALACQARWFLPAGERLGFLAAAAPMFLLAYPVLFMLDRGNWEGFVLLLSWFYLLTYKKKISCSWVLLAAASLIKPQVVLLGLLPLLDKDHPHLLKAGSLAAAGGLVLLLCMPGPLLGTIHGMGTAVDWFFKAHMWPEYTIRFNHTVFGLVKGLLFQFHGPALRHRFWEKVSHALEAGLLAASLSRLWRARAALSLERRALVSVSLLLWLPSISFDYTLIHLLPVFFLIVGDMWVSHARVDGQSLLPLLCLILAPKQVFIGAAFPYAPSFIVNGLALPALTFAATAKARP